MGNPEWLVAIPPGRGAMFILAVARSHLKLSNMVRIKVGGFCLRSLDLSLTLTFVYMKAFEDGNMNVSDVDARCCNQDTCSLAVGYRAQARRTLSANFAPVVAC